jgi:hypothetical protein
LDIKKPDVCASGFLFGNSNNSLLEKSLKQNIGAFALFHEMKFAVVAKLSEGQSLKFRSHRRTNP